MEHVTKTLESELELHLALMRRPPLVPVSGAYQRRDMVEFQSTQKMRTDIAKTLDSELELHDPAFMSYALH